MEKIVVGPEGARRASISTAVAERQPARPRRGASGVYVADLTVAMLDRPRHEGLIREVRQAGARISCCRRRCRRRRSRPPSPTPASTCCSAPAERAGHPDRCGDALRGRRHAGAPAGRAAKTKRDRAHECGIETSATSALDREMASGSVMFAGTGVTNGDLPARRALLQGARLTNSVVMRSRTHTCASSRRCTASTSSPSIERRPSASRRGDRARAGVWGRILLLDAQESRPTSSGATWSSSACRACSRTAASA